MNGAGIAPSEITVVVPTRNEAANIGRFLASVPAGVETILIDSSQDGTADLAELLRPEATSVLRTRANIPTARQLGGTLATTPWVLFTDADVVFDPDYFDRLATTPIGPDTAGLVGVKGTVDGFDLYHRWFVRGQALLASYGIPAATGSNMAIRRDVLDDVGGFDCELTVNEDTEVMFRIHRRGHPVAFRPDLCVRSFDHRRLEAGLARKVAHGAARNTALYLGVCGRLVRRSDWGYWPKPAIDQAIDTATTRS